MKYLVEKMPIKKVQGFKIGYCEKCGQKLEVIYCILGSISLPCKKCKKEGI